MSSASVFIVYVIKRCLFVLIMTTNTHFQLSIQVNSQSPPCIEHFKGSRL